MHRALDRAHLLLENQRYRDKLESANRELAASLNLLQEDQNAGRQVQMNMLPISPWSIDDFDFAHQIIPSLYLSGDFVDYFRVDERRVAFYLADVSGHGASSDGLNSGNVPFRLDSNNKRVVMNLSSTVTNAEEAPWPETSAR